MNNKDLLIGVEGIDRRGYKLYLRSESIKKIFLSTNSDKSYTTFLNSKWYRISNTEYSQYLCDMLDQSISYTEYLSDQNYITTSNYTNYVSDNYIVTYYNQKSIKLTKKINKNNNFYVKI